MLEPWVGTRDRGPSSLTCWSEAPLRGAAGHFPRQAAFDARAHGERGLLSIRQKGKTHVTKLLSRRYVDASHI